MSGEKFEGQDAGYVPENLENIENLDFPPTLPDEHDEHDEHGEGNVIDETGFPQLQPDELDDEGNLDEEADLPENKFDGQDVEDLALSEDAVAPLQEQMEEEEEEHHDEGVAAVAAESFGSLEKQGAEDDLKSAEIKKWPGWPGENVFRMLVPAQKVGSVIGRKGEFIKKITEETKARIKVLDGPPGTAERAVVSIFE